MIKINLLPEEFRVEEHASPTRILVIAASILIGLLSCGFFLFVRFHELPNTRDQLKQAKIRRDSLRKYESQHKTLNKLLSSFASQNQAVAMVKALRVPLSIKIYQFANLIGRGSHPVWIDNLTVVSKPVKATRRRGKKAAVQSPPFQWKASCTCASKTLESATKFYNAMKKDEAFYKDFVKTTVYQFTRNDFKEGYEQKYGWKFSLDLTMQMQPKKKQKPKKKGQGKGK